MIQASNNLPVMLLPMQLCTPCHFIPASKPCIYDSILWMLSGCFVNVFVVLCCFCRFFWTKPFVKKTQPENIQYSAGIWNIILCNKSFSMVRFLLILHNYIDVQPCINIQWQWRGCEWKLHEKAEVSNPLLLSLPSLSPSISTDSPTTVKPIYRDHHWHQQFGQNGVQFQKHMTITGHSFVFTIFVAKIIYLLLICQIKACFI